MAEIYSDQQLQSTQNCIDSCVEMRRGGALEDALRHNLSSYLRLMFTNIPKWVELHITGSEAQVEFSRNQNQHRGFVDSLVGATAIEYEGNLRNTAKYRTGYRQVAEYCAGLLNIGYPAANIRGVLSDTVQWYAYDVNILNLDKSSNFSANDLELIQIDNINCEDDTNSNFKLLDFLEKHLGRIGSRKLSADSINSDLGFNSKLARDYIPLLQRALNEISLSKPEYAELIRTVWNKFVNSVRENDTTDSFDIAFYVDEFFLTTVAKCLCANVLSESALISDDEELKSILSGHFFKLKGYENVVEYDFFGWLNNLPVHISIIDLTKKIQLDLRAYDYGLIIEEDLFSNLFSELANKSKRLLLGQAMTPSWLANSIVRKVISDIDTHPKLIDMCCGSGTFVVETIKIVAEGLNGLSEVQKRAKIISSITGFDIDPLAVILARINWLMVANSFISVTGFDKITIPIYNADSLFAVTPVSTNENEGSIYSLSLLDEQVHLPKDLLLPTNKSLFEKILDVGYSLIVQGSEINDDDFYPNTLSIIQAQLSISITEEQKALILTFMQEYYDAVFRLHSQGKNGIWNFLLLNSFRPALVENSFNGLVSNPPWLTLSRIADNPYKFFLQNLARDLNIRPTGSSFLHIELATIFLLSSIDRYLIDDAKIGCVLPGTVLSGDHHHPFRNKEYDDANIQFRITEIWDLDKVIFKNRSIAIFGKKSEGENLRPIPYRLESQNYVEEESQLYYSTLDSKSAWTEYNINRNSDNSYVNDFSQGADIMPRSLYFHEIGNYQPTSIATHIIPINMQVSAHAYLLKESKKFSDFRIETCDIETSTIFPVMISNVLLPFHIITPPLAILPIEKYDGSWRAIPTATFVTMSGGFQRYINRASAQYGQGTDLTTLWNWLNTRSKLINQNIPTTGYIVCSGTGGEYVCAHYLKDSDIDFNRLVIDQTVNFFYTNNENEAKYLVGLLNSPSISNAIRGFQSEGNFGARHIHSLPYRIIEPFDESNNLHTSLVAATTNLIIELDELFNSSSDSKILRLRNSNESNIAFKRRAVRSLITSLDSYNSYIQACEIVINGDS
jgi:hypothetical protein